MKALLILLLICCSPARFIFTWQLDRRFFCIIMPVTHFKNDYVEIQCKKLRNKISIPDYKMLETFGNIFIPFVTPSRRH